MRLIHKIRAHSGGLLALVLLGGFTSPSLVAQQRGAVNRDPQVRVESPDRSVVSVDADPEKPKPDAPGQVRVQQYSNWGLPRNQVQKTAGDRTTATQPASSWEHKSRPTDPTVLFEAEQQKPLRGNKSTSGKTAYGISGRANTQIRQPRTRKPGTAIIAPPAPGYMNSQNVPGKLDFASRLTFDPARKLSSNRAGLRTRPKASPPRAQGDSYCRASTLSMETKQRCAQLQKKRNRVTH